MFKKNKYNDNVANIKGTMILNHKEGETFELHTIIGLRKSVIFNVNQTSATTFTVEPTHPEHPTELMAAISLVVLHTEEILQEVKTLRIGLAETPTIR